jgi:hypothetical protein
MNGEFAEERMSERVACGSSLRTSAFKYGDAFPCDSTLHTL